MFHAKNRTAAANSKRSPRSFIFGNSQFVSPRRGSLYTIQSLYCSNAHVKSRNAASHHGPAISNPIDARFKSKMARIIQLLLHMYVTNAVLTRRVDISTKNHRLFYIEPFVCAMFNVCLVPQVTVCSKSRIPSASRGCGANERTDRR